MVKEINGQGKSKVHITPNGCQLLSNTFSCKSCSSSAETEISLSHEIKHVWDLFAQSFMDLYGYLRKSSLIFYANQNFLIKVCHRFIIYIYFSNVAFYVDFF